MSDPDQRLERAASLIADRLNSLHFEWRAEGRSVIGPGTTAFITGARHSDSPRHLDIGFVGNRNDPESRVIWDCSTGYAKDFDEALVNAVDLWVKVSAPVWLELFTRKGEFADHYHEDDSGGFDGWHAICGPWIGWGRGNGPDYLQRWALDHPLLPQLRDVLDPAHDSALPIAIRLFFGASSRAGDVAEVQVNGDAVEGLSAVLASLSWPRLDLAYVRSFALLVHPEPRQTDHEPGHSQA